MGKSLLDVQRDLRIKAVYISAIENGDIDAFPNKAFIAGYVRSYARYLKVDPEDFLREFCEFSGVPYELWEKPNLSLPVIKDANHNLSKPIPTGSDNRFSGKSANNWLLANRALSKKSRKNKSNPFDQWLISAAVLAIFTAIFIYVSFPFSGEAITEHKGLVSFFSGIVVFMSVNWLNPRFFFMKLVYLFFFPILASTIFGLSFQIEGRGDYFGGFVTSTGESDHSIIWPVSILIALAMYFQFLTNRE